MENEKLQLLSISLNTKKYTLYWFLFLCLMPLVLNFIGVDFGIIENSETSSEKYKFLHVVMEWTAMLLAFGVVAMSCVAYRLTGDVVTPIIGAAFLCSGLIDAFHALASAGFIDFAGDTKNFIAFTWTIARLCNSFIVVIGVIICLYFADMVKANRRLVECPKFLSMFVFLIVAISLGVIYLCSIRSSVQITRYPDGIVSRLYDVFPLVFYLIGGGYFIPKLYFKNKSFFTFILWLSVLPDIMSQCYMVFNSIQLFDNAFMIAHYFKVTSHSIPLIGFIFGYLTIFQKEKYKQAKLKLASKKLSIALVREKDAGAMKARFASMASHEFRTPLASIRLAAGFINQYNVKISRQELIAKTNKIEKQVLHMTQLLDDVMLVGHVNVKIECNPRRVNFYSYITEVIVEVKMQTDFEGQFEIDCLEETTILLDEKLGFNMFSNLFSNAMKFSKPGGVIKITLGEESEISIADNGIGIGSNDLPHVFETFYRGENVAKVKGAGLGLSIVKKSVDLHGGNIKLKSKLGKGTDVIISLPSQ